ncbi:zinc-binding protein A33-like [Strongylocentrotus purpuratus]|uniref:Uncharacterized protein n=1 Tax=Strongylocentrotus purpuratus TaxID=7668 RepID=A0A7M7PFN0_STRPU|nr:zinc-binding protein A33-like [Strongylocentrotus purpuratus]|eukprot:XP_011672247.1 PREDICTED: zinc-binding protein A33-like [Strongylocentrotus purpuratus]
MAEKGELQFPESLACPLCLEVFKAPTLLQCGHTFCKDCLDKYDKKWRGQDFMECPLCKKHTKLGKNRVAGLSPNFSVKGLEDELHVHHKINGKSSEYCSLHSQVYKDILCEVCKEFICLTCLFDKHHDHSFKKNEEFVAELNKNRDSLLKESKEKKAQIKESITNAKQHMRDMHSHLDNLDREIENSFREKSEILRVHRERLSKENDDFRKNSHKLMTDFIQRQEQSLQSIDVESTFMGQKSIASTRKFPDSDALKIVYIRFLVLKKELDRDFNDLFTAGALQEVEDRRFCPYENNIDLGTFDQDASVGDGDDEEGFLDQDASVGDDDDEEGFLEQEASVGDDDDDDEGSLDQDASVGEDDHDEGENESE